MSAPGEDDLKKVPLEDQNTQGSELKELEDQKAEALANYDGGKANEIELKIEALKNKYSELVENTNANVPVSEIQLKQVGDLDGSSTELENVTGSIDSKIEDINNKIENKKQEFFNNAFVEQEKSPSFRIEENSNTPVIKENIDPNMVLDRINRSETNKNTEQININPEFKKELDIVKSKEEDLHNDYGTIVTKQAEILGYDDHKERISTKLTEIDEYEEKFKDYLDREIIIDPEKGGMDMISFKGLDSIENNKLTGTDTGIYELGPNLLNVYKFNKGYNENPQRIFEVKSKTETTLRKLFADFKAFLNKQLEIPKPTQTEIDAIQEEVNLSFENYKKAQQEVKDIEKKIAESASEMEVPKPPKKFNPLDGEFEDNQLINKPESIKDFKETMIVSEDGSPIEKNSTKETFKTIEKPKNPESIGLYLNSISKRLGEIPEEYRENVEDIMQILDQKDARDIVDKEFNRGDGKRWDVDDETTRTKTRNSVFEDLKNMTDHGSRSNSALLKLIEKYPDKIESYKKMESLEKENRFLEDEKNEFLTVQKIYTDSEKMDNFFKYQKGGITPDGLNMSINNKSFNLAVGKKLVELGVITQENLNEKLNNFLEDAKRNDEFLINMRRDYPEKYEATISKYKQEFGV